MMSRKARLFILILAFLSLGTYSLGQHLPAIDITPLLFKAQLAPGQSRTGTFGVTNRGDKGISLKIGLKDFTITKEGGFIVLEPGTLGEHSLANYLTYSPQSMELKPGESQMVHYSFTLPSDATDPHWATLIVSPEIPTQTITRTEEEEGIVFVVNLQLNYAFIIIQRELNPPEPAGQMVGIDVSGSAEDDQKMLTVWSTFQNLCDDVLGCQVYMEVRDEAGGTILRYDFPPDRMVLPNTQRVFSHAFDDVDMPPGQYLILCVVDFGGDYLAAGQYLATITALP